MTQPSSYWELWQIEKYGDVLEVTEYFEPNNIQDTLQPGLFTNEMLWS